MKRWVPIVAAAAAVAVVGAGLALFPGAAAPAADTGRFANTAPNPAPADLPIPLPAEPTPPRVPRDHPVPADHTVPGGGLVSGGKPVSADPGLVPGEKPGPVPVEVPSQDSKPTGLPGHGRGRVPDHVPAGPVRERLNEAMVVRDGDRVEIVSGRIIAVPGEPVRLCGGALPAVYGAQWWRCGEGPTGVTLVGVDLGELQSRDISPGPAKVRGAAPAGTVFGRARLVGTWHRRTVTVERQGVVLDEAEDEWLERVPCPRPSGGWKPGDPAPTKELLDYVNARPEQLATWIAWPDGFPQTRSSKVPGVVVVGVAHGDPDAVRALLRKLYPGNLCVTRIPLSPTETEAINVRIRALPFPELGIHGGGGTGRGDRLPSLRLTVLDEKVVAALRPIGLQYLDITPDIRRVS